METIETPVGDARVDTRSATGAAWATLVLGHGAGGGIDAADLVALADSLPARGVSVLRVEQPWRVAGRRVATAPPTLDRAWLAVLAALDLAGPVVVGGRSAGARVACRTAAATGAAGVLALAFPLHPPGRPERSRLPELDLPAGAGLPVLVLQGTRDPFGGPGDVPSARGRTVVPVEGGDHGFRGGSGADRAAALGHVAAITLEWLSALVGESSPGPRG